MVPTPTPVPALLKLLAHDVRWELLAELSSSDRRVAELVSLLDRPQNLISYHLARLRAGGLVREHRSSADARDVYYRADLSRLGALYRESGASLHPALVGGAGSASAAPQPARVLFLCTHNSARSQMAERLLRAAAGPAVVVASAGSQPSAVHPLAARVMADLGFDITGQRSKHMAELASQRWHQVVTVCDLVREVCPVFPAETRMVHWSIPDPAAVMGTEAARLAAFQAAAEELSERVSILVAELRAGYTHPSQTRSRKATGPLQESHG